MVSKRKLRVDDLSERDYIRLCRLGDGSRLTDMDIDETVRVELHHMEPPEWWRLLPAELAERLRSRFQELKTEETMKAKELLEQGGLIG